MILSFKTESTEVLERFLKNFLSPDNIFMQLIHNVMFTEKKLTRMDDVFIIQQESLFGVFGKFSMLPSVTLILVGLMFNYFWMLNIGAILLIMSIILLSKHFLLLTIIIKLKMSGHKPKIEMVSDGFLLSKLLMEYENGTFRSQRILKK